MKSLIKLVLFAALLVAGAYIVLTIYGSFAERLGPLTEAGERTQAQIDSVQRVRSAVP